jgi:hypothetical protein
MLDISNKLHAMVDEFVSNLSSQCDSLVNNVSGQGHVHGAHDSETQAARAPRPGNRTTSQVLNGLRRPTDNHVGDAQNRDGKPRTEAAKSNLLEASRRSKDDVRSSRQLRELRSTTAAGEDLEQEKDSRSVDTYLDIKLSKTEVKHGSRTLDTASKGKFSHTVEILSSDNSSDESLRPLIKSSKIILRKQKKTSIGKSTSQGCINEAHCHPLKVHII